MSKIGRLIRLLGESQPSLIAMQGFNYAGTDRNHRIVYFIFTSELIRGSITSKIFTFLRFNDYH